MTAAGLSDDVAQRKFAAHETFAPRFGWLKKAYDATSAVGDGLSDAFLRPRATVDLGVGKNMVHAIRYWASAFKLTDELRPNEKTRAYHARATEDARWLLDTETGADPWLESPGSLWLLHWWLLKPRCLAPTWWVAFNLLPGARFRVDDLIDLVEQHIELAGWSPVMRSSIVKDVDCLTKMYAPRTAQGNGAIEDLLDCPFRDLGLMEGVPDVPGAWRIVDNPRTPVPAEIVAYACVDFMAHAGANRMQLARLAHEPGSVGKAFRMAEPTLNSRIAEVEPYDPGIRLDQSLAQVSLHLTESPEVVKARLLNQLYRPDTAVERTTAWGTREVAP